MSEWSDEACDAFWPAYSRAAVVGLNPRECMRAALTAADAVRKREAGEKRDLNAEEMSGLSRRVLTVERRTRDLTKRDFNLFDTIARLQRRIDALEAARPAETSGYAHELATQELPPKPATERRCGTCAAGKYHDDNRVVCCIELPPHIRVSNEVSDDFVAADDSCDLWQEARP